MELAGVDLVIPVFNEEKELPKTLESLAMQVLPGGEPLPRGLLRVIIVDNGSTDGTRSAVESVCRSHPALEVLLLHEPVKSHIQARIRGADEATRAEALLCWPVLASADADTRFHPQWIADIATRFARGGIDAASYAGHFPLAFWRNVPRMARRYTEEVGTIFFGAQTIAELKLDPAKALFTEEIFFHFGRMPSDCAFALTKQIFSRAGGYRREYRDDGREVLGEGWNLKFRLDRIGARIAYVNSVPYETSPRRLLLEATRMLEGESYADEMSDLRDEARPHHHAALEKLAESYDLAALRRYIVRNYILLPCITRPSSIASNEPYFGAIGQELAATVATRAPETSPAIHDLADELAERYGDIMVERVRAMRNLATARDEA